MLHKVWDIELEAGQVKKLAYVKSFVSIVSASPLIRIKADDFFWIYYKRLPQNLNCRFWFFSLYGESKFNFYY